MSFHVDGNQGAAFIVTWSFNDDVASKGLRWQVGARKPGGVAKGASMHEGGSRVAKATRDRGNKGVLFAPV